MIAKFKCDKDIDCYILRILFATFELSCFQAISIAFIFFMTDDMFYPDPVSYFYCIIPAVIIHKHYLVN